MFCVFSDIATTKAGGFFPSFQFPSFTIAVFDLGGRKFVNNRTFPKMLSFTIHY